MVKSITLICPTCSRSLTVGIDAPAEVTCPACLGSVDTSEELPAAAAPKPVIPIERQTSWDGRIAAVLVALLPLLLLSGIVAAWLSGRNIVGPIIFAAVIFGIIAYVLFVAQTQYARRRSTYLPESDARLDDKGVLEYAKPGGASILHSGVQFTIGFILVVAVVGSTVAAKHSGESSLTYAALSLLILGIAGVCFRRARSIGLGILIAVWLCIVLPFGICFLFAATVFR